MFRRAGKLFIGAAAVGILCIHLHAADFEEVSRHLDKDGDYFEFNCTAETNKKLTECFHEIKSSIASLDLPEDQRMFLSSGFETAEMLIEFSGIKDIVATGRSSKALDEKLFCNKSFYLLRQPANGMLWSILPPKNTPILQTIGEMPADTRGAIVVDLDFTQKEFQEKLQKLIPPALSALIQEAGIDAKDLGVSLSGRWQLLLLPENGFLLIIPDAQKKAYSFLQGLLESQYEMHENGTMTKDGIAIGHNDGWLVIAKNFAGFENGYREIKETEFFQKFAAMGRADGIAAYFGTVSREPEIVNIYGIPVNLSATESNQLGIVRRDPLGLELLALSDTTIPGENLMTAVNLVCRSLAFACDHASDEEEIEENQHGVCQQNLQTLYAALTQYREKHGSFPKGLQAEGWKALLAEFPDLQPTLICPDSPQAEEDKIITPENCSYIYFGDWGNLGDGTMPLVVDVPTNHMDSFNVLYSDGSVATLEQENVTAVRKQASLLHTLNRYNEARFIELMRRAAQIDQLLKLE